MVKMLNKETFSQIIVKIIEEKKIPALEAVILYAEEQGMEMEVVAKLIDKTLKEKIESEAHSLNLLKSSNNSALPI